MPTSKLKTETYYIDCSCSKVSHALVMRLVYDDSDPSSDTTLYLDGTWCRPAPFWKRLARAFMYVVRGMECRYWDEFEHVFDTDSVVRVAAVIDRYNWLRKCGN